MRKMLLGLVLAVGVLSARAQASVPKGMDVDLLNSNVHATWTIQVPRLEALHKMRGVKAALGLLSQKDRISKRNPCRVQNVQLQSLSDSLKKARVPMEPKATLRDDLGAIQ
jgi:hypothetical protein